MPKVIELTFEIEVQKVSCPGVWLCQDGRVSLTVFALGTSYQTCLLPPVFPLMFKDIFYFRKRFQETCALNNICCLLKDETIYCELVQWSADCVNSTCAVLAQYLGSLNDILFPPNMCAGEGVDLLMRRAKNFPGILSPKIEIATKVRIDEIYSQPHTAHRPNTCRCVRSDANTTRQKQVCHSQQYHRAAMVSPKRSTETSTYYPCDQEYRYAGNAQKGTELLSPGERDFTQKSNSCKCKKRSRSRSRSACRSMSSVAVKEQDYNYCACPPNSHSGLKCRKRPSGTQSPCRLRHAVGVYTALTPSVDQMWTQVADASGNEDDRRSSCLSDNDDFNDQQIQRLTIESRFIDQENYEEKPKEKQHASYSRSPCVCEICKRYHELFHSKPSYHSVMKQAF